MSGLPLKLLRDRALGSRLYRAPEIGLPQDECSHSHFVAYPSEDFKIIFSGQTFNALTHSFFSSFTGGFLANHPNFTAQLLVSASSPSPQMLCCLQLLH